MWGTRLVKRGWGLGGRKFKINKKCAGRSGYKLNMIEGGGGT